MVRPDNVTFVGQQIGSALRARRKELGLSQAKLARAIGVSYQQVQKYEVGADEIPAGRFADLATALRVPVSYFFDAVVGANQVGPSRRTLELLMLPGAAELLECYREIECPSHRRRLLALVRFLAGRSGRAAPLQ